MKLIIEREATFENNSDMEVKVRQKIDWLTALRHISPERLLVPRYVAK